MSSRPLRLIALAVGLFCVLAYGAWQWLEPHGSFEFAYAPFAPGPLPYSPMRGFTYEQLWGHVRRICLLGPGSLLFAWGLCGFVRWRPPRDWGRVTKLACAASLCVTALLMLTILRGRALVDDELAYAMQAGFFGRGHIAGPDLGVNPGDVFTVPTRLGYAIKYLPGEPLMQIPGVWLGAPALLHLPIVAMTLWAWHQTLRRSSGLLIARLATICLACSPMIMFTSATGLSHATALMWVALMGLGVELARAQNPIGGGALAGVSFGFGLLTRPQSMAPIGAVLGGYLLWHLLRRRAFWGVLVLGLTAGAGLTLVLAYNRLLSGSPFKLPWSLQCGAEHYGFGRVWVQSTFEHGFVTAVQNLGVVAVRLNAWLLGWPWSLAVVVAWVGFGRHAAGASIWLVVGLAVVAFEFLYYSPGISETGSIYHYELVLPFSLMAAVVAERLFDRYPSTTPVVVACCLLLGTTTWIIEQGLRLDRLVTTIYRDGDAALARIHGPAVLIHETRDNEIVRRGWVFDSFPRRFRDQADAIVTLPRVARDMPARAARVYPGRACWYFHYLQGSTVPELLRCEDARSWLERSPVDMDDDPKAPFVENSTAYLRSDYAPTP